MAQYPKSHYSPKYKLGDNTTHLKDFLFCHYHKTGVYAGHYFTPQITHLPGGGHSLSTEPEVATSEPIRLLKKYQRRLRFGECTNLIVIIISVFPCGMYEILIRFRCQTCCLRVFLRHISCSALFESILPKQ